MSQLNPVEARITQKSGIVYVEREGERLSLEVGDAIYESDLVITGPSTTAEIQYLDGTISKLAPETQMRLVDFEYDASVNSENSFLVDIAEGAMRTVTGEIVKLNPDAFEIVTPRATVGIRGTDIATQINDDGSETHVIISIGRGHRVEITTHDGQLMSLYSSNEGAFIPVDLGGEIKPYIFNFTTEEIDEIIKHIEGAVSDENLTEEEELQEQDHSSIIIDQSTVDILGSEIIDALTNSLESAGLTVLLPEALALETVENEVILVPGTPDGDSGSSTVSDYIEVSFDGQGSYYADGTDMNLGAGVSFTASKTRISITQDVSSPTTVISGDVNNVLSGTVNAADDIISGTTMSNGRVVGDAQDVSSGATLIAGNDEIVFDTKTGGNSIYGDALTVATGATASFGDDTITIKGVFSNSVIAGDANYVDPGASINKWGNDTITVGSISNARIFGDDTDGSIASYGDDVITVLGTMEDGAGTASVEGMGGDDTITVHTFLSGDINGGAGDDEINITNAGISGASGGRILTVFGDDVVNITNLVGNLQILNQDGADSIYITNGIDSNTLTIDEQGSGTIELFQSAGNYLDIESKDTLEVYGADVTVGTVRGSITGHHGMATNDTIRVESLDGGRIETADGNDSIVISNFVSGTINAGADNDSIIINTLNGSIDGGAGDDTLTVTESGTYNIDSIIGIEKYNFEGGSVIRASTFSSGTILADYRNSNTSTTVDINTLDGGEINASHGGNNITITKMLDGSISSGNGSDDIFIGGLQGSAQALEGGDIYAGSGDDSIDIKHLNGAGGTINIDGGLGADTITIEKFHGENNYIVNVYFDGAGDYLKIQDFLNENNVPLNVQLKIHGFDTNVDLVTYKGSDIDVNANYVVNNAQLEITFV